MMPSFNSGFAADIRGMMEWRGTLGYTESCYMQQLTDFDRYCQEAFPDAGILTWEISGHGWQGCLHISGGLFCL